MGKSLDQILADDARLGDLIGVSLVTNEDDHIASYATGQLVYRQQAGPVDIVLGGRTTFAHLSTSTPLKHYFSDRRRDIDPPPGPDSFGNSPRQPFDADQTETLDVSVTVLSSARLRVDLRFGSGFGHSSANVTMEAMGDLFVGLGPALSAVSAEGVYVLAFGGVGRQPA